MIARALILALAALLPCACGGGDGGPGAIAAPRPHVLLITLDTTRPDHLGCYGYRRATSPCLDRLAAEGVVYERAYSTSSWTLPAHASLFTGKFPSSHGARFDEQGPLQLTAAIDGPFERYRARGLAPGETTLAALLSDAGYATGGVVAGPWMKRVFGLGEGFAHWDDDGIHELNGRRADQVTDAALAWLEGKSAEGAGAPRDPDKPFFLFLNYFDPHTPYAPPAAFAAKFAPAAQHASPYAEAIAAYDGEIAFMDREIGRLFDQLARLGLYDDCWIVVTADHGELFGELGLQGHGMLVSEPEIRVPLVVKPPRSFEAARRGKRETRRVQLVDVLPEIAEKLGLEGRAVAAAQGQPFDRVSHPILAEFHAIPPWNGSGTWRALFHGDLKYVWNSMGKGYLCDVARDPREDHDLSAELPEQAAKLARLLDALVASLPPPPAIGDAVEQPDPETLRALEGLGYVK